MGKVFGVKEAQAAEEFAVTSEQKRTVLAVVKMLGMPINLAIEVGKKVAKLDTILGRRASKVAKVHGRIDGLEEKIAILGYEAGRDEDAREELLSTQIAWEV